MNQPPRNFGVGALPGAVAVGDVNGDGKLDVVAGSQLLGSLSVLLGNGNGTLQPQKAYPVGALPTAITLVDVSGDGKLDAIVANKGSGRFSVLIGDGDGTFKTQGTYAAGSQPRSMAVGDVSGDDVLDVVVVNSAGVSILRGNGDGTYKTPQTFATASSPSAVTLSDLNGDGKLDVVVATDAGGYVSVFVNGAAGNAVGQSYVIDQDAGTNLDPGNLTPSVTGLRDASQVTSVVPFIGPTSGGTTVVISGVNFVGVTAVRFGGVDATSYTVNCASQIVAVTPAGSSGLVDVSVTNVVGTSSTSSSADDYTYAAPEIVSVVVNGGAIADRDRFGKAPNLAGQNSVVEQILVAFNQRVKLDADAFSIVSLAAALSATGESSSTATVSVVATGVVGSGDEFAGYAQYLLTFAPGAGVNTFDAIADGPAFTTLKDGSWRLLTAGSRVHAGADTASDRGDALWSLFGAVNAGDVRGHKFPGAVPDTVLVDGLALNDVYAAFGSGNDGSSAAYDGAFDWNLDGFVDGVDLNKLYQNFGTIWKL